MISVAILGMGNRGTNYAMQFSRQPEKAKIVAIADTRKIRTDTANKYLNLPEDMVFSSSEELFSKPKLADLLIIATLDGQHREHAIKALSLGYDLLLEKPMATTLEDCYAIKEAAHKYGRKVFICHVLRYTVFYSEIRRLIREGLIGKVETINATENVGYYHQAHSYVRGNWHNTKKTSPMILAKCCHDMDIFLYLTGRTAKRITSFGSLDYFVKENCPAEATERCTDPCPIKDCPYNAKDFYFSRLPGWPTNILHPEPTEENILEILKTTDYGKCVYKMDNDAVDHQVTNILLDDGCTVSHTMTAFGKIQNRNLIVHGTKGVISGSTREQRFKVEIFGGETYEVDLTPMLHETTGHGGGDYGLTTAILKYYNGEEVEEGALSSIDRSTESHVMAFAAEYSRLHDGESVDVTKFGIV